MKTSVLITGVNGFVGQALFKEMTRLAYCVKGTVRSKDKIPDFIESKLIHITGSLGEEKQWADILDGVNIIFHLAARVHITKKVSSDALADFRKINTAATINLARQGAKAGVKRFVFISTIKVNGETTDGLTDVQGRARGFAEADMPDPRTPYALSKWEAEKSLAMIAEQTGLEVVIVRPPLVYGPEVKANFKFLLRFVKMGIPLPLGAIANKRSFLALDNLVSFLIECAEHSKAANELFLISDGLEVSTPELIKKMADALGKKAVLFPVSPKFIRLLSGLFGKKDATDRLTSSLQIDTSKAIRVIGWHPVVSMTEQLKRMVTISND